MEPLKVLLQALQNLLAKATGRTGQSRPCRSSKNDVLPFLLLILLHLELFTQALAMGCGPLCLLVCFLGSERLRHAKYRKTESVRWPEAPLMALQLCLISLADNDQDCLVVAPAWVHGQALAHASTTHSHSGLEAVCLMPVVAARVSGLHTWHERLLCLPTANPLLLSEQLSPVHAALDLEPGQRRRIVW